MRRLILLILAAFTISAHADDKVIYRKEEKHQFQGSKLKGQIKKPDLTYIYRRQGLRAEKILKIPDNFDDEVLFDASQF
jgi:hypothetical protein